jgi:hypothetical protein
MYRQCSRPILFVPIQPGVKPLQASSHAAHQAYRDQLDAVIKTDHLQALARTDAHPLMADCSEMIRSRFDTHAAPSLDAEGWGAYLAGKGLHPVCGRSNRVAEIRMQDRDGS